MSKKMPKGFHKNGRNGDIACPHRDISCCAACAKSHVEIVDVYGQHFWIADETERNATIEMMKK